MGTSILVVYDSCQLPSATNVDVKATIVSILLDDTGSTSNLDLRLHDLVSVVVVPPVGPHLYFNQSTSTSVREPVKY